MTKPKLVAVVIAVLAGVGTTVYAVSSSTGSSDAVSILEDATGVTPAFAKALDEQWLLGARELSLSERRAVLVTQHDGVARRYSISPDGTLVDRGETSPVAAEPFDLRTVDLSLVPGLITKTRAISGPKTIGRVVVGRNEDGPLLWRVEHPKARDVYFRADGTHVPDPDVL
ncbi:MAG: hypothetical protein AAF799_25700 [Myxococcota bacterium]